MLTDLKCLLYIKINELIMLPISLCNILLLTFVPVGPGGPDGPGIPLRPYDP